MSKISNQLLKALNLEVELIERTLQEKQGLPEEYEDLERIIKASTMKVTKEQMNMMNILKDFVKRQEARGRTALIKTLKFYLDSLDQFDFTQILTGLKEEIQASKRETDEITKIEMDRIKSLKELLSSPEQHIAFLKEASEKFVKAEKQFLDADAERKRLLSEIDKQRLEADAERKKLIAEADAERKKLLAENDAERKKLIADADAERKKQLAQTEKQLIDAEVEKKKLLEEKEKAEEKF